MPLSMISEDELAKCRHRHRRYPIDHRQLIFRHYGHGCVWCAEQLDETTLTVDHVICVNDGGSDWIGNLLPACSDCNIERAESSAEDWRRECIARGKTIREALIDNALRRVEQNPYALHPVYKEVKQERARLRGRFGAVKRIWEMQAKAFWEQPLDLEAALKAHASMLA